ncbi:MAG: hypothetical protein IIZ61_09820 [Lachnospiraceae bacterium]|nr:hypothetical protein [Lachnospiraceae bacterium]
MGLSVARIGAVSGMSPMVGVNAVSSYAKTEPMNYTVDNESEVSGSYVQSLKNGSVNKVGATPPVRYANATVQSEDAIQKKQDASRAYNQIAAAYTNENTTYGANMRGQSYQAVGQNIDLFA